MPCFIGIHVSYLISKNCDMGKGMQKGETGTGLENIRELLKVAVEKESAQRAEETGTLMELLAEQEKNSVRIVAISNSSFDAINRALDAIFEKFPQVFALFETLSERIRVLEEKDAVSTAPDPQGIEERIAALERIVFSEVFKMNR